MKKKILLIIAAIFALTIACTACGDTRYTVTFSGEGVSVPSQTVVAGKTAIEPNDPVRDGYIFDGWRLDGEPYDFSSAVNANITLVASWKSSGVIEGEGTAESPFLLAHPNHLALFSERVNAGEDGWYNGHFRLVADIDMAGEDYSPAGRVIDESGIMGFSGIFDGNGHKISNLKINEIVRSGVRMLGLFGYTHMADISNLTLENIDFTVESYSSNDTVGAYIGGVAAYASTTNFTAISVTGKIRTGMMAENSVFVGGMVGELYNSTQDGVNYIAYVENCFADIDIDLLDIEDVSLDEDAVGGLIAYVGNSGGTTAFINCRTQGTVVGGRFTGGIVGYLNGMTSVIDCSSSAAVSANDSEVTYVGGIVGSAHSSNIIIDSFTTGKVAGVRSTAQNYRSLSGGIVGYAEADDYELYYTEGTGTVNCYYSGRVSGYDRKSGEGTEVEESALSASFIANTLGRISEC